MLKKTSQVGKGVWSDIIFIIIIHLLLLSLYVFAFFSAHSFETSKAWSPATNVTILGV